MMNNSVVIRVDSSAVIGTGHVMRCLHFAQLLKLVGFKVSFICRDYPDNIIHLLVQNGYLVDVLHFDDGVLYKQQVVNNDYDKWLWVTQQDDAKDTVEILSSRKPDIVVVDHYGLGFTWENYIRSYTKRIIVIDDLANRKHDCDILIDHNYYQNASTRYIGLVDNKTKLLLGPRYLLASSQLNEVKNIRQQRLNKTINSITIYFGGADLNNYSLTILKILMKSRFLNCKINILIGSINSNKNSIIKYAQGKHNIEIFASGEVYYDLLSNTDLFIGAGGVSQLERAFVGIASIIFSLAKNQDLICENMAKIKGVKYLKSITEFESLIESFSFYENEIKDPVFDGYLVGDWLKTGDILYED